MSFLNFFSNLRFIFFSFEKNDKKSRNLDIFSQKDYALRSKRFANATQRFYDKRRFQKS